MLLLSGFRRRRTLTPRSERKLSRPNASVVCALCAACERRKREASTSLPPSRRVDLSLDCASTRASAAGPLPSTLGQHAGVYILPLDQPVSWLASKGHSKFPLEHHLQAAYTSIALRRPIALLCVKHKQEADAPFFGFKYSPLFWHLLLAFARKRFFEKQRVE